MLSLQQAIEIKESIKSYLQATFTFRKHQVAKAFDDFIEHPTQGMFKGPYVSLKLRFEKADAAAMEQIPLDIKPSWPPYDHQVKAWTRLATKRKHAEPTIVTTGTGSGKTESFLYPMLDYCFQQQHRRGVKVIILYPMNALATDQAKRLAEMIAEDPRLKGRITAGLFIGEGNGKPGEFPKTMGEDHIIEHRDTILDSPPDILLTNFKMLDYALMKHNFHKLWTYNLSDPSLLKFLVLDELHTYDGAQGTDVANLIRRLKLKLNMAPRQLCPVGTSATIGSGADAPQLLSEYASKVFGEPIGTDAIITENRINPEDFFGPDEVLSDFIPGIEGLAQLEYNLYEDYNRYIDAHLMVWQQDKATLSQGLQQLKILKDLVLVCNKGKGTRTLDEIMRELSMSNPAYRALSQWDDKHQFNPKERLLESLFTLITQAKDIDNPRSPFMYLQVQLWVRELSGVQYTLEEKPQFSFRDKVDAQETLAALPPWYCRECNSSGWLGVKKEDDDKFSKDVNEIYEKFFDHHKHIYFLLPKDEMDDQAFRDIGYQYDDFLKIKLNPTTLQIIDKKEEGIEIQAVRKLRENKTEHICPCCNTLNTVAIIGTKIPTLSSIAVSQTLATDLDKAEEKERKVLAFTNSVQDAAHQAGFIESRNYRFSFRASLQKVINQFEQPLRLDELADKFIAYWKANADETGQDSLNGYLYRFFPKDYIGKASPEDFKMAYQYAPHFLKEFDQRIQWEVYSEFGFNSRIGRTLEKTGSSSVFFDPEKLKQVWNVLQDWVRQNDVSGTINEEDLVRFTNLILHRSRTRGALNHLFLSKFRTDKLSLWDLNWNKDGRHFLNPKFGTRSRLPKLLTNQQSRDNLLDTTRAKSSNWFHSYFRKAFPLVAPTTELINEFYEHWTNALMQVGILNEERAGEQYNYAIEPSAIMVAKTVKEYRCNQCEDILYANDAIEFSENGACLNYRCTGHYVYTPTTKVNYYQRVYNRQRFPRVYAREHTGLLERKTREYLERDFKNRTRFNSTNTLIATSTLEMGIDIGSLNTAYNNNIPPLTSNFLQRVGRAGRSSGSAMIVNFAKNQQHDLYYYAAPLEMMQGEVHTPGCYLEAKDILKRHFLAYCIDSWTSDNPAENVIPTFVRDLKLKNRQITEENFFANRLINFIKENKKHLVNRFLQQYEPIIREQIFVDIQNSLDNETFYDSILDAFRVLKEEIRTLEQKRIEIDQNIKALNLAKGDPLFEEFIKEKKNLGGLLKSIHKRNTLEHLTNEGYLPNYAFPETGVKLHAHVLNNTVEGSTNVSLNKEFEVVRPASQAIKELAPENFFYTQGYRFEITGVNTFDWTDATNFHNKRFCSKCDYIEIDSLATIGNCPKCGDHSWSSSSNVHKFAKLTNVRSVNSSATATLTDSSDDREQQSYHVMHHVSFDANSSAGSWVLKDIPFGIEFVKSAKITSVNYGRADANDARKVRINEAEVLTKGFVTCKHCGKSISSTHRITDAKDFHYGYCKYRGEKYEVGKEDIFEEVYFFREMQTELLKIVLPIQEFNSEADIRMFQAGLELGLKRYFKGNPGHLHILPYREYNQQTEKFDRFLLLYDTIPGGTGYLEQLFDHEAFSTLMRYSYETIRDCSCQLEGHDGCYRCIYSYGNQYNRADLSRARAEKWFAEIVDKSQHWERNNRGLTSLTNSGKIEESELEERFIKLLKEYCSKKPDFRVEERKENGAIHYLLFLVEGDVEAQYWIRPQVVLGPKDGIEYSTRVDFLVICAKYLYKNTEYTDQVPKYALYLDGYKYHASDENNVFTRDVEFRKAISSNAAFRTWTFTWKDLDRFQELIGGSNDVKEELGDFYRLNFYNNNIPKIRKLIGNDDWIDYGKNTINAIRFIQQLTHPPIGKFSKAWHLYLSSWTKNLLSPTFNPDDLPKLLTGQMQYDDYFKNNRIVDLDFLIPVEAPCSFSFVELKSWVNIKRKTNHHLLNVNETSSINKEEWEYFWHLFNIFQTGVYHTINESEEEKRFDEIGFDLFAEIASTYPEEMHAFIKKCVEKGHIHQDNYEHIDSLLNENGDVIADAELVIDTINVAVNPYTLESKKVLEKAGFTILTTNDLNNFEL